MENLSNNDTNIFPNQQQSLPNATAVLVLGIISIVGCFCYGIVGMICSIIALVLAKKDSVSYALNPQLYSSSSYSNLKAGRVCAIIGIILSSLYLALIIIVIAVIGIAGLSHPEQWMRHYQ